MPGVLELTNAEIEQRLKAAGLIIPPGLLPNIVAACRKLHSLAETLHRHPPT